jgi:hypothetical protein
MAGWVLIKGVALAQDGMRNAELAGVVHGRRQGQLVGRFPVPAARQRQRARIGRHAPDVGACIGIVVVARVAQHQDGVMVTALEGAGAHQRQVRGHACAHERRRHRFHDVVDTAGVETGFFMFHVAVASNEDDPHGVVRIEGLQAPAQRHAVGVGQADVEQHHGRLLAPYRRFGLGAGAGEDQPVLLAQDVAHDGQVARFVVHDQYGQRHGQSGKCMS